MVRISSSELDILAADRDGQIETYCTFNEYFLERIDVDAQGSGPVYATLPVEELTSVLNQFQATLDDVNPAISVYFTGPEFESEATEIHLRRGDIQAGRELPEPRQLDGRPPTIPIDVDGLKNETGIDDLSELADRDDIPRSIIARFVSADEGRTIIPSTESGSPPKIEGRGHNPPQPLSRNWRDSWLDPMELPSLFNRNNILELPQDERHRPAPIRIETTLKSLRKFYDVASSRRREPFRITVEDSSWVIDYGDEDSISIEGSLTAGVTSNISERISNCYGDEFKHVVENLPRGRRGEQVELQTAPGGPLAFVLRDRSSGAVLRHVIQSPGT
ncbi:hypothetical protein [Halobacterium sp. CBA1126]|uniref:hypothetical protein n=1 Tax=Halobacterium sp. CBA1126 TaxID=2668074 RepID=UPI0012F9C909|nr:hypothetical protein [Halobacterium sp. CBA1126]MUV60614.1 hypothetical protein [Halobacterium sp. CBA1126]